MGLEERARVMQEIEDRRALQEFEDMRAAEAGERAHRKGLSDRAARITAEEQQAKEEREDNYIKDSKDLTERLKVDYPELFDNPEFADRLMIEATGSEGDIHDYRTFRTAAEKVIESMENPTDDPRTLNMRVRERARFGHELEMMKEIKEGQSTDGKLSFEQIRRNFAERFPEIAQDRSLFGEAEQFVSQSGNQGADVNRFDVYQDAAESVSRRAGVAEIMAGRQGRRS